MASRPTTGSARGRSARAGRSTPPPKSPLPLIAGGVVALIVVVAVFLKRGDAQPANAGQSSPPPAAASPALAQPAAEKVRLAAAKVGKAPTTPAPALSEATLQELSDLIARVKALRNESVTARTAQGDNQTARQKMVLAKTLLEEWLAKVGEPLRWQESAQMEDWAQPAEYATLEALYAQYQRLENEVRKGGG